MTTLTETTMAPSVERLTSAGQSIWLDFIRRAFIDSGDLKDYVDRGWITGLTSNPSIFAKAIAGSTDYDEAVKELASRGVSDPYEIFVALAVEDIQRAADIFLPVYERTDGADGFVSLETPPGIAFDAQRTVTEARRLFALVDRPNVMIKVPGTDAGIEALEQLVADEVNVNVTLLFSGATYRRVVNAYVTGLERRHKNGLDISRIASVASFFISRIDTAVDSQLPEGSELEGATAIANARRAYFDFLELFGSERWTKLEQAGARVQRPLWASTSTKNPGLSDVLYVDELVADKTVNTMPESTLVAFADHGDGTSRFSLESESGVSEILTKVSDCGVDLAKVTDDLLTAGLASFADDFDGLLQSISDSLSTALWEGQITVTSGAELDERIDARLESLKQQHIIRRIWRHDPTVWSNDPREITDRLGWLTVADAMSENVDHLVRFAAGVRADGFTTVALLGMGGSSLGPEVLARTFAGEADQVSLVVLDTTDPASIQAVEESTPLDHVLFIAASKSGTTIETLTQLEYFWNKVPDGSHFVAITDPGTHLSDLGRERSFRRVFINPPDIGGRYSALSYFGLVPAALVGVDIARLLDGALSMRCALDGCVPVPQNPGALLGAAIGESALAGRDKLTIVVPDEISSFGTWVEQLIAESTGKNNTGILPVEGEEIGGPEVYGADRLFVTFGDHPGLAGLEDAGHPVIRIPFTDKYQLGEEFLRWEMATAVAGNVLGIHPFDQPNVQEAKDITSEILDGTSFSESTAPAVDVLGAVTSGDYIALLAYVPRNSENEARLRRIRHTLRDRFRVATTVGFGPRFLHSTGQLHKGGPNTGVFLQIVGDDPDDIEIPGRSFTFGELKHAQALGDLESLRSKGRRVARTTIDELEEIAR